MAPEETTEEATGFTSPFFTASPFAQQATPTAPMTDDEDAEDEDVDAQQSAQPGASFGLVFQAPDPQQRVPKRERPQSTQKDDDTRDDDVRDDEQDDDRDADGDTPSRERSQRSAGNRRQRGEQKGQDDTAADEDAANDAAKDEAARTDGDEDESDDQMPRRRRRGGRGRRGNKGASDETESSGSGDSQDGDDDKSNGSGRGKQSGGRNAQGQSTKNVQDDQNGRENDEKDASESDDDGEGGSSKRTRRRRRSGSSDGGNDEPGTVTKVREPRKAKDEVTSIKGSTRLEAKRQRRREGREAGRRRTVITEAEFLARRESVERTMVVREQDGRTQIGVLEDGVLAEHYVSRQEQASSMAGNVYLGRVQNVLPSMEAAFVDIGRGRNAVLYAGEVNWDAAGLDNKPKRIEHALKAGESVLVQVTKDPIGHKGARLTSQISLPGRYVVFVPGNSMTGISRKLPDTERSRLKKILKEVVPADAGVIVRTAAEGASEEELRADVERLMKMWEKIQKKAERGHAPSLLHGEPDLTVRVIRDVFNEDFAKMIVEGDHAWDEVDSYISEVAPDLQDRLEKWTGKKDVFSEYRIDEQLAKAMDRKVWLPSGGSLVIDRTEAMTVVDVNTGKFVGSGGNLEETVTKNNIEAAEEIVRQLRLRDIGGIIVIDFIDMVLESNRDLVVRRLLECLGRDRTKHQVAEVTSLGLVQMTRKRVGSGLIEVFSEPCEACEGRGIIIHDHPVENRDINGNETNRKGRGRRGSQNGNQRDNGGSREQNQHQNGSQGSKNDNGSNGPESANERDNRFAQIAAAAHAAAISAGDKSAVSEPVSTGSSDKAVMTETGAAVEPSQADSAAAASSSSTSPTEKKSGRKRTGRVQRPAERAAQQEAESPVSTEAAGASESSGSSGSPSASEASHQGEATSAVPAAKAPARKRGSRRAATSSGAPARTGEAQVMTVPAGGSAQASQAPADQAASHQRETPAEAPKADAVADKTDGDVAIPTTAAATSAPKRARRRAATSAGAPVSLQPVDLTSAGSSSAPLTQVAGAASSDAAPKRAADADTTTEAERKAPARRKRARVSAPAGAPTAQESSEG